MNEATPSPNGNQSDEDSVVDDPPRSPVEEAEAREGEMEESGEENAS